MSSVIDDIFLQYSDNKSNELTAQQIQTLHADLRMGGISMAQVKSAISFTCVHDTCDKFELVDLLNEMDRRYFLLQDLRWEFSFLDLEQRDAISEDHACWFVKSVHGDTFLERRWKRFLRTRAIPGSNVTFGEIEVMLCDIPSKVDLAREIDEAERERQDAIRRERKLEEAAAAEIEILKKEKLAAHEKEKEKKKQEDDARWKRQIEEEEILKKEDEERKQKQEEARLEAERLAQEQEELVDLEKLAQECADKEREASEELAHLQRNNLPGDEGANKAAEDAVKRKQTESKHKRIRYQLKVAIKDKDKFKLKYSVKEFLAAGLADEEMDLAKAERLIKEFTAKDNLKQAITKRDIQDLERAMTFVRKSGFESQLQTEMAEAAKVLQRLKRLERIRHEILELKQSTVAEIRSYQNPPIVVHTVMTATLLLLGHKERETKDWRTVQALIGRTGKVSLKRMCLETDPTKLDPQAAARSKELLGGYEIDNVRDVSAGAATFYVWAATMIEEAEELALVAAVQGEAATGGSNAAPEMSDDNKLTAVAEARERVAKNMSRDRIKSNTTE